jgi:deoxyribonuclease-4
MAKIFLGPAGIPIKAKKRDTIEGIKTVKELGLNAMEVEFVQGVKMSRETAIKVGEKAKELGVRLSVHAPYFINLCSEDKIKVENSKKRIYDSADRAHYLGADAIAIHVAAYGKMKPRECLEKVKIELGAVIDLMKENGINDVKLGVETMGKRTHLGTLEEVIEIYKQVKGVVPYIDWAHTFARQGGKINYDQILDLLINELKLPHINSHFEGLKRKNGEYVDIHEGIEVNAPPFEPLARELAKRDISITIICESPYLEEDALKMKRILEGIGLKLFTQ